MIRVPTEKDAGAIASVHVASWRETYPGIIPEEILDSLDEARRTDQWRRWFDPADRSRRSMVVYERAGRILGFCSGTVPPGSAEAELETLYLLKGAQGQGHGRRLLVEVAGRLQELGATSLVLWMAVGNPTAGFDERLGGRIVETKAKPFGPFTIEEVCYRWEWIGDLSD